MGSTEDEIDALLSAYPRYKRKRFVSEVPQHWVDLDAFYIYKHLVTVGEYLAYCKSTGHQHPEAPAFNPKWSKLDHPIVNVSWEDAQAYCAWLSLETGRQIALPTEAQWEKAARGMDGRHYPWGDEWDEGRLHCSEKSYGDAGGTAAAGSYPAGASPYGVLDMAGNVWEWCADWDDANYYQGAPFRNPPGPQAGSSRILRGGSWYTYIPLNFRCANRYRYSSVHMFYHIGFRYVVRADTV